MKLLKLTSVIFFAALTCCQSQDLTNKKRYLQSIEQVISGLSIKDTIDLLDLSHRDLKTLPDLSAFLIRKLDISHNKIDSLIINNLPNYIVILDASNNEIKNGLNFINVKWESGVLKNNVSKHLKEIDLSHNKIKGITIYLSSPDAAIDKIILSNSDLQNLNLHFNKKISFLDISNNREFSNILKFNPSSIENIKHDRIATDEPLKFIKREFVIPPDKH